jgi:hypothetical protein
LQANLQRDMCRCVGTLLGSSSLPTQCRKDRFDESLSGLGGSVALPAFNGRATCDGGLGDRPSRHAMTARCARLIAAALDLIHSRFAFVA